MFKILLTLSLAGLIVGCTINPSDSFQQAALSRQLQSQVLWGEGYSIQAYTNLPTRQPHSSLHVYLDGDGTPWLAQNYINQDPTPVSFTVLDLIQQDPAPSLYLGRPCYHQVKPTANCHSKFWTSARYSKTVINSMRAALNSYIHEHQIKQIIFIGFSGGGSLAMLMARQIPMTRSVITLAGNLDTDAWTHYHHYQALSESLNPAIQAPLPKHIQQIHLTGAKDKNIPPHLLAPSLAKQPHAKLIILPSADHHCCWQEPLSEILKTLVFK